jgi:thiol-disulfide isomerase/thioredoxin
MRHIQNLFSLLVIGLTLQATIARADSPELKPFTSGSYQQILTANAGHPFMLVLWSQSCSSCLKDMSILSDIHKAKPDIKIILVTTDNISESSQALKILKKNRLANIENWIFADDNSQQLQSEIDSKWFGELPRTYFFDNKHQRAGVSGVLSRADLDEHLKKIIN